MVAIAIHVVKINTPLHEGVVSTQPMFLMTPYFIWWIKWKTTVCDYLHLKLKAAYVKCVTTRYAYFKIAWLVPVISDNPRFAEFQQRMKNPTVLETLNEKEVNDDEAHAIANQAWMDYIQSKDLSAHYVWSTVLKGESMWMFQIRQNCKSVYKKPCLFVIHWWNRKLGLWKIWRYQREQLP